MHRFIFAIAVLVLLATAPAASAQIYKCNGPAGPIFTDKVCGPEATKVEIEETSGLGGVYDETIAELAKDKAQREAERTAANRLKANPTVINNQFTTVNTEPAGYWLNNPYLRPLHRPRPRPEPKPEPAVPGTLGKPKK